MIRVLMVSAIVCGLLAAFSPANAADQAQEPKVSVNHEWGKLTEVVIGRGDTLRMPGYSKYVDFIYDPQYLEKMKQNGGKDAMDLEPELTKKVIAQIDNLAEVLQKRGIKVHRPALLDQPQSQFLDYVQKGRMQLYARDPMLVIGNNVFETALKVPMRAKERFGLRPILRELAEKRGAKFVAMPMPDPSFPDDGIYIEGGDVQLNGYEIYVGNSGRASTKAGIAWLQQQLGPKYKVIEVPLDSAWEHLDCVLALLKPGLGLIYRPGFKGELPAAIRDWDYVEVTLDEAKKLAANALVLDETTCIIDAQHQRIIKELRKRGHNVVEVPYDAVATWGGAFRCSHHPIIRQSVLK